MPDKFDTSFYDTPHLQSIMYWQDQSNQKVAEPTQLLHMMYHNSYTSFRI